MEVLGGKVDRLEASTRRLTAEIDRLGATLTRVRKLEDEQVELREQTTLAMYNALAAHDTADASAERLDTMHDEAHRREVRRRYVVRLFIVGLMILLPIVAALVYAAVLTRVDGLVDRQRGDLIHGCQNRNATVQVTIDREQSLADLEKDPTLKAIHLKSVESYKKLVVDCTATFGSSLPGS